MADESLLFMPAAELARSIADREVSSSEVIEASLRRAVEVDAELNCFAFVLEDSARRVAADVDGALASGAPVGPLAGVPVALKDTTPTTGDRTTLGSFTHEHWVADRDGYVAAALRRAGAVIVGKTTSPEFAHTLVTDSPLWGPTRNPWDPSRTPGGSSGGSAVAVATGCVALAEGSDMGGSVRIPAAWTGVVGLKPSLGRIPMDVLPGMFDTISHHGPLARSVDDARLFLACTQGPDDADILSVPGPLVLHDPGPPSVEGLRLALSVDLGSWAVDPGVAAAVERAAEELAGAGATVEPVDLSIGARDEWVWVQLWQVFMAAYYGHLLEEWRDRMDPDVVSLIEAGNTMSAVDYKRLELERTDLWRRVAAVLADHDAILCPTMAVGPLPAAKSDHHPQAPPDDGRYHAADMTSVWNLVSPCPVLSVPCGFDADGLPVGLQIVGRRWREDLVLRVGAVTEQHHPFTRPPHP